MDKPLAVDSRSDKVLNTKLVNATQNETVKQEQNINSTQNSSGDEGRSPTLYDWKTKQILVFFPENYPMPDYDSKAYRDISTNDS